MVEPSPAVRSSPPTLPGGGFLSGEGFFGTGSWGSVVWLGRGVVSLAALVLLLSGALKVVSAAALLGGDGLLSGPIRLVAVVSLEGFVAGLLLTLSVLWAARVGLFVFAAFGSVAAWTLWSGADCGCFGSATPRGLPLAVDLVTVVGLGWVVWRVPAVGVAAAVPDAIGLGSGWEDAPDGPSGTARATFGGVTLGRAVLFGVCLATFGGVVAGWRVASVVGEREGWPAWLGPEMVGQALPWPEGLAVEPEGRSAWVLLRPDCQHCREFAEAWAAGQRFGIDDSSLVGVAVESGQWTFMPGRVSADAVVGDGDVVHRFNGDEPFVGTPMVVEFVGPKVVAVRGQEELGARRLGWDG